jgi:hypothetical protein
VPVLFGFVSINEWQSTFKTHFMAKERALYGVGTQATMRNGPPLPSLIFMGSAIT